MTPPPYKGQERRTDDTSVRLALLEQAAADAKERDKTTQNSLAAVHKRISETRDTISGSMEKGFAAVIGKIEDLKSQRVADKKEQDVTCKGCADDISTLKENRLWMKRWLGAAWAGILTIGAWIFAHSSKVDPDAVSQAAAAIKKLKGGG